jgi:tetratricopeptide (TPR) repeat protein
MLRRLHLSFFVLVSAACLAGCNRADSGNATAGSESAPAAASRKPLDPATEQKAEALFYEAAALYEQRDFPGALKLFSEVIELSPENAVARHNRGTCYEELAQWDKAIADYREALRLDPIYVRAYNSLGNAYTESGDRQRARESYRKAIELDPSFADAHCNLGNVTDDSNEAITHYSHYFQSGDKQRALDDFTAAIAIDPLYATAYFNRASVYQELGQASNAAADLARAREIDPQIGR